MSALPPEETKPLSPPAQHEGERFFIPVRWRHRIVVIGFYIGLIVLGVLISREFENFTSMEIGTINDPMVRQLIIIAALLFVLTSALPFVPGAEIGFGLLLLFGAPLALLVYGCMVLALVIAFLVGRMVPCAVLAGFFHYMRFNRAAQMVTLLSDKSAQERLDWLTENAPSQVVPSLLKYRYLAVMVILNLPGNTVIGGGGGIALIAGMSGLFKFSWFLLAIAVAIAPVPVAFWLMG